MIWKMDNGHPRAPISDFLRDVYARELVQTLQEKRRNEPDKKFFNTFISSGDAMVIGCLEIYADGSEHYTFNDCIVKRVTWGELSEILPK